MQTADLKHLHQDLRCLREDVRQRLAFTHAELRDEWSGLDQQLSELVRQSFDDARPLLEMKQRLQAFRVRCA